MDADTKITLAIDFTSGKIASPSLQRVFNTDWQKINFGAFFPAETWLTVANRDLQLFTMNLLEVNKLSEMLLNQAYSVEKPMKVDEPQDLDDLEAVVPGTPEAGVDYDTHDGTEPEAPAEEGALPDYVESIYTDKPVEVLAMYGKWYLCVEETASGGARPILVPDEDVSRRYMAGEVTPEK